MGRAAAENHHKRDRHAVVPLQHRRDPDKENGQWDGDGIFPERQSNSCTEDGQHGYLVLLRSGRHAGCDGARRDAVLLPLQPAGRRHRDL